MPKIRFEVLVRIFADIIIVNSALLSAFVLNYVLMAPTAHYTSPSRTLGEYIYIYRHSFWLLTPVSIITFYITGFYTKGRAYRGRYKVLTVAQAVTLSFLIFGFLNYFLFPSSALPRRALLIAWLAALLSLIAARIWSYLWKLVVSKEQILECGIRTEGATRNILLIGGAGYIGSALLPKLLEKGYRVRLMDLFIYGSEPISKYLNHPQLEIVHADFRQVCNVVQAMVGMDAVIHIGAIVGDPACALHEDLTIEVNLIATKMIAEVAKGQGISKLIFASTCSVYGASDQILDENSTLNPVSLYARSKIASERVLIDMGTESFVPVILRFGTIYGLSGRTRFDLVVNLLAAKAAHDGQITVDGTDQWRPFIHVQDAARAIVLVLEAAPELLAHTIFNVGSDEQNFTLGQVGQLIKRMVPSAELICTDSDSDRRNYRVDFKRIRHILGFRPEWTLEQGVQQVLDAIANGRVTDYHDAKYSNVKFLTEEARSELLRVQNGWEYELLQKPPVTNEEKVVAMSKQERVVISKVA